jgi:hypothetical protein
MLKGKPVDLARLTPKGWSLATPELPESLCAANDKLRDTAEARWPFEPEHLLESARRGTGLADFGDPVFREALDRLCTSARNERTCA